MFPAFGTPIRDKTMRNRIRNALFKSNNPIKLYSVDELRSILTRERARSDRNNHEFSVLVFELGKYNKDKTFLVDFCHFLASRLRSIDETGWFADNKIGIILPYTIAEDAAKLAEDIRNSIEHASAISDIQIFTYPSVWPFKKKSDRASVSQVMEVSAGRANNHDE
ncbi:MAG: hypothetical protein DWQ05_04710 [Calditrichaeota bacterium]|nr:MAG: hypothetical protein DWQ05_04710 [Calditrichota bacterium]